MQFQNYFLKFGLFLAIILSSSQNFSFASDQTYLGEFVQKSQGIWVELNTNGQEGPTFREVKRGKWSLHLLDSSRGVNIFLDLAQNKIYWSLTGASTKKLLYQITSPLARSTFGYQLSRVAFSKLNVDAPVAHPRSGADFIGYMGYGVANRQELANHSAGVSMYIPIWPLVSQTMERFQVGLPSIWIQPDNRDNTSISLCPDGTAAKNWPERGPTWSSVFQTVEGGAGYWGSTGYRTVTPKFAMNATPQCYDYYLSTPGWAHNDEASPDDKMGMAQLSNRIIVPPDAFTFKGNPNGELLGYSWMALPIADSSYLGEFRKGNNLEWYEYNKNGEVTHSFSEIQRDEWSVYLYDSSRNMGVQLDLFQKKVFWYPSNDIASKKYLYKIVTPSDSSQNGWSVNRAVFASGNADVYGNNAPTGDNTWTFFINSKNFKGPVAFIIPEAWSRIAQTFDSKFNIGRGLDARMMNVASSASGAMEFNQVPYIEAQALDGTVFRKYTPMYFPTDDSNRSILVRDVKAYTKDALYNQVLNWRRSENGSFVSGSYVNQGIYAQLNAWGLNFNANNGPLSGILNVFEPKTFSDGRAWGLEWKNSNISAKGAFPNYFKRQGGQYIAVSRHEVPIETGLHQKAFQPSPGLRTDHFSPESGSWGSPGPVSEIFKTKLNDGSEVSYRWYRFIDQPAFQYFNFNSKKRQQLQRIAEEIHRNWHHRQEYMAPPSEGQLVEMDDALIVKPPSGLEYGYVPIVVRQEPAKSSPPLAVGVKCKPIPIMVSGVYQVLVTGAESKCNR